MKNGKFRQFVDKIKPTFEKGGKLSFLHSSFEAVETFLFVPNKVTTKGSHIRDGIDLKRSFTVGDHPHDAEFARSVGATGVYVLTGHGVKHRSELRAGFAVVPSLADAGKLFRV